MCRSLPLISIMVSADCVASPDHKSDRQDRRDRASVALLGQTGRYTHLPPRCQRDRKADQGTTANLDRKARSGLWLQGTMSLFSCPHTQHRPFSLPQPYPAKNQPQPLYTCCRSGGRPQSEMGQSKMEQSKMEQSKMDKQLNFPVNFPENFPVNSPVNSPVNFLENSPADFQADSPADSPC